MRGLQELAQLIPRVRRRIGRDLRWGRDLVMKQRERLEREGLAAFRPGDLTWMRSAPCFETLLDAGGAQIGDLLYVVCGYTSSSSVNDKVLVFDMSTESWRGRIATPPGLAHSHCAVATDGQRYIYFASGQVGPQCRPAVQEAFSYDTFENVWEMLPPLPYPRYAATMQYWRGRLHIVGGASHDRWTPTSDHWSIAVDGGRAQQIKWQPEQPIPIAGMHRSSAVIEDVLYVFGGQQGDFQAIQGDPHYTCSGETQETYLDCAFRLDNAAGSWKRIADLPIHTSHADFATLVFEGRALIVGGQVYKHPETFSLKLSDAIQAYDPVSDRWEILGHLPHRLKVPVVGIRGNELFVATGQRGTLPNGVTPGEISRETWKTRLARTRSSTRYRLAELGARKRVVMISHDLSRTGSPLLLLETAKALEERGASVRVVTASGDVEGWNLASEFRVPLLPLDVSHSIAAAADVVIVNTASEQTKNWVREYLSVRPEAADRLVWWIHEIDVEQYQAGASVIAQAATVIFDSEAARSYWSDVVALPTNTHVIAPALRKEFVEKAMSPALPLPSARDRPRSRTKQTLNRDQLRRRLGVRPRDFLVCSIGTFHPPKGQRMLIRTVAKLAAERGLPLKLLIVGLQDKKQRLSLLKELSAQERRVLTPARTFVSQAEYAAFYRASDVFVMNSQGASGRGETFGRVTIEAMAFGLPVAGTAAGGTKEVVVDGVTGLLFPLGELGQTALADCLAALEVDRSFARKLGQAGRRRAFDFYQHDRFLAELEAALSMVW